MRRTQSQAVSDTWKGLHPLPQHPFTRGRSGMGGGGYTGGRLLEKGRPEQDVLSLAQLPGLGGNLRERKRELLAGELPFLGDYMREGSQATLFWGP